MVAKWPYTSGEWPYTSAYNQGRIARGLAARIQRDGFLSASIHVIRETGELAMLVIVYGIVRRKFRAGGKRYRYHTLLQSLGPRPSRLPLGPRLYNVFWGSKGERLVEIPLVEPFIRDHGQERFLEVGNVLNYHLSVPDHDVVDKYEVSNGVWNQDIETFEPQRQYDLIVSISTLEHIGLDEEQKDEQKARRAFEAIVRMLSPGGKLILTVPYHYNPSIDELIWDMVSLGQDVSFFTKDSHFGPWREVDPQAARSEEFQLALLVFRN